MTRSIVLALLAVLGSTGPLESCYGVEYRVTLMPDGTGKIEVRTTQKVGAEDLKKPYALLELVESTEGVVAFTPVKTEVKGEWREDRFTAYFEDLAKVVYKDKPADTCDPGHAGCIHFGLTRTGGKLAVTIEDWIFNSPGQEKVATDENWQKIKDDSANIISWIVTMPGAVSKVDGFQKMEGRRAIYERGPETIKVLEDARKWPPFARRRVECGKSEVPDAELAAFKKELAAAKEAWPKIKADLEAAQRKAGEK